MKLLLRLAMLGLAAYGGKSLWERYGSDAGQRKDAVTGAVDKWRTRVTGSARGLGADVSGRVHEVEAATEDAVGDVKEAVRPTS